MQQRHRGDPTDDAVALEREREVVARLREGDRAALATLYEWYGDRLFRAAILPRLPITDLAEDVLRDTFRLTLERIHQYQSTDRSIYFWMRRIAINRAIDVHRANARRRKLAEAVRPEIERTVGNTGPSPERAQDQAETKDLVEETLALLNPRYAQALRLRMLEDRDRDECAAMMGVTIGNFDVILHRASKAFRTKYPPR